MSNMKTLAAMAVLTALISGVLASARADDTQGTSAYVAGNGKYCKETSVSGYLDCFYASLEACQKHNKSNNRCLATQLRYVAHRKIPEEKLQNDRICV
jgi:hypothetical protein